MWSLLEVVCCFPQVFESYDCQPSSNSSIGKLCGFSAVKVKLVDSLI